MWEPQRPVHDHWWTARGWVLTNSKKHLRVSGWLPFLSGDFVVRLKAISSSSWGYSYMWEPQRPVHDHWWTARGWVLTNSKKHLRVSGWLPFLSGDFVVRLKAISSSSWGYSYMWEPQRPAYDLWQPVGLLETGFWLTAKSTYELAVDCQCGLTTITHG